MFLYSTDVSTKIYLKIIFTVVQMLINIISCKCSYSVNMFICKLIFNIMSSLFICIMSILLHIVKFPKSGIKFMPKNLASVSNERYLEVLKKYL